MASKVAVFLFPSFLLFSLSIEEVPFLENLSYKNPDLIKLREEIKENMKNYFLERPISIKWRRYRIRKKDTFFFIMARVMLNHDTLSSVNSLASLWDVEEGDIWLIPNMRGIAVEGEKEELTKLYPIEEKYIFPIPGKEGYYFLAGLRFPPEEWDYLRLEAFSLPVECSISSSYGIRKDPFTQKKRFHKGVDFACEEGTPVKASQKGKVVFAGEKGEYGYTIILEHWNGYQTLYAHLRRILVREGSYVPKGAIIGEVGSTGRSTGPHLHFEVRRKGRVKRPSFTP